MLVTHSLKAPPSSSGRGGEGSLPGTLPWRYPADADAPRVRNEHGSRLGSGELDDSTPVIARLNQVSAGRKAAEAELDDLMFQQRHAEWIARRLNGFDQRFLDAQDRVDTMGYDERRAILRQFSIQVTLWKQDHDPGTRSTGLSTSGMLVVVRLRRRRILGHLDEGERQPVNGRYWGQDTNALCPLA